MTTRANSTPLVIERVSRVVGLAALGAALVLSVIRLLQTSTPTSSAATPLTLPAAPRVNAAASDTGPTASATILARVIGDHFAQTIPSPPAFTATVHTLPGGAVRAVLGAAIEAGASLRWSKALPVRALSLGVSRDVTPMAPTLLDARVSVSRADSAGAGSAAALVLRDQGGVIDSIDITSTRASANASLSRTALRVRAMSVRAPLRADVMRGDTVIASATAALPASPTVRSVLLFARPGWEAKFVSAALEEAGWTVEASLQVSPKSAVRLGAPTAADTARYSVVVVLDSGVVTARQLERFLQQGGGVVVSGDALRDGALANMLPARVGDVRPAIAGGLLTAQPRRGLGAFRLQPIDGAVVLDREDGAPVLVAARRAAARVVASAYRATWQWRMEGADDAADAHRRWWTSVLATASAIAPANARAFTADSHLPGDAAPFADWIARVGPAHDANTTAPTRDGAPAPLWWLFAVATVALLVEWTSRRLRGAP